MIASLREAIDRVRSAGDEISYAREELDAVAKRIEETEDRYRRALEDIVWVCHKEAVKAAPDTVPAPHLSARIAERALKGLEWGDYLGGGR